MNVERLKVSLEIFALRSKGYLRTAVQLVGLGLVLLGAYNLLAVPLGAEAIAPYRQAWLVVSDRGAYFVSDFVVMGFGAILAWFA